MMRLIVNADDLGAGEETDRGILESFETGIVTTASLLPNGPSFLSAARLAQRCGIPVGIHLNLSEGQALSGPIPGMTDGRGIFLGKGALRRALAEGTLDRTGLRRELRAQVERVFEAGLAPDHVDTHQHFFLFPAATEAVLETARSFGVRAMRLSQPAEPATNLPSLLGEEVALYRKLAPRAARALRESGILCPDGLLGMPLLNTLDEEKLLSLLERLPPGTFELMVHPGYPDPLNPFSDPQRPRELAALTSPRIRRTVRDLGIDLITFGDLSCAS